MNIFELWNAHSQDQFPAAYGGVDVNGVCVTSIDTYASGCISTYIKSKRDAIDIERYQVLQKCHKELEIVLPELDDEALFYFSRLREMCSLILNEAKIA